MPPGVLEGRIAAPRFGLYGGLVGTRHVQVRLGQLGKVHAGTLLVRNRHGVV
jgi:hypothetical protein